MVGLFFWWLLATSLPRTLCAPHVLIWTESIHDALTISPLCSRLTTAEVEHRVVCTTRETCRIPSQFQCNVEPVDITTPSDSADSIYVRALTTHNTSLVVFPQGSAPEAACALKHIQVVKIWNKWSLHDDLAATSGHSYHFLRAPALKPLALEAGAAPASIYVTGDPLCDGANELAELSTPSPLLSPSVVRTLAAAAVAASASSAQQQQQLLVVVEAATAHVAQGDATLSCASVTAILDRCVGRTAAVLLSPSTRARCAPQLRRTAAKTAESSPPLLLSWSHWGLADALQLLRVVARALPRNGNRNAHAGVLVVTASDTVASISSCLRLPSVLVSRAPYRATHPLHAPAMQARWQHRPPSHYRHTSDKGDAGSGSSGMLPAVMRPRCDALHRLGATHALSCAVLGGEESEVVAAALAIRRRVAAPLPRPASPAPAVGRNLTPSDRIAAALSHEILDAARSPQSTAWHSRGSEDGFRYTWHRSSRVCLPISDPLASKALSNPDPAVAAAAAAASGTLGATAATARKYLLFWLQPQETLSAASLAFLRRYRLASRSSGGRGSGSGSGSGGDGDGVSEEERSLDVALTAQLRYYLRIRAFRRHELAHHLMHRAQYQRQARQLRRRFQADQQQQTEQQQCGAGQCREGEGEDEDWADESESTAGLELSGDGWWQADDNGDGCRCPDDAHTNDGGGGKASGQRTGLRVLLLHDCSNAVEYDEGSATLRVSSNVVRADSSADFADFFSSSCVHWLGITPVLAGGSGGSGSGSGIGGVSGSNSRSLRRTLRNAYRYLCPGATLQLTLATSSLATVRQAVALASRQGFHSPRTATATATNPTSQPQPRLSFLPGHRCGPSHPASARCYGAILELQKPRCRTAVDAVANASDASQRRCRSHPPSPSSDHSPLAKGQQPGMRVLQPLSLHRRSHTPVPSAPRSADPCAHSPLCVDKTYVINLRRRPRRWDTFLAQARRLGLTPGAHFSRFDAVDGSGGGSPPALPISSSPLLLHLFRTAGYASRASTPYPTHEFVPGVLGCALSHLLLWQELASRPELPPHAAYLVLEDDARMSEAQLRQWQRLRRGHLRPPPPSLLRAAEGDDRTHGDRSSGSSSGSAGEGEWGIVFLGSNPSPPAFYLDLPVATGLTRLSTAPRSFGGGTFGYAITKRAATALLAAVRRRGLAQPIDWFMLAAVHFLPVLACHPPLTVSDPPLGKQSDTHRKAGQPLSPDADHRWRVAEAEGSLSHFRRLLRATSPRHCAAAALHGAALRSLVRSVFSTQSTTTAAAASHMRPSRRKQHPVVQVGVKTPTDGQRGVDGAAFSPAIAVNVTDPRAFRSQFSCAFGCLFLRPVAAASTAEASAAATAETSSVLGAASSSGAQPTLPHRRPYYHGGTNIMSELSRVQCIGLSPGPLPSFSFLPTGHYLLDTVFLQPTTPAATATATVSAHASATAAGDPSFSTVCTSQSSTSFHVTAPPAPQLRVTLRDRRVSRRPAAAAAFSGGGALLNRATAADGSILATSFPSQSHIHTTTWHQLQFTVHAATQLHFAANALHVPTLRLCLTGQLSPIPQGAAADDNASAALCVRLHEAAGAHFQFLLPRVGAGAGAESAVLITATLHAPAAAAAGGAGAAAAAVPGIIVTVLPAPNQ